MSAIPIELITLGVSSVWGGLLTIAAEKAKQNTAMLTRTLQVNEAQESNTKSARGMQGWHFGLNILCSA